MCEGVGEIKNVKSICETRTQLSFEAEVLLDNDHLLDYVNKNFSHCLMCEKLKFVEDFKVYKGRIASVCTDCIDK